MEQRPLRLGDILDDYCPRERRVTNHAVVAMIEDNVKQTRCTTCDAEHAYKGGREPRRRRKEPAGATSGLYREVLAGMPEVPAAISDTPEPLAFDPGSPGTVPQDDHDHDSNGNGNGRPPGSDGLVAETAAEALEDQPVVATEDGPIHRRLIRATLPRPEGQKEVRQVPDFTVRSNGNRPQGQFRGDRARGSGSGARAAGRRFGGGDQPAGFNRTARGGRPGFGGGNQRHGGRKRSR